MPSSPDANLTPSRDEVFTPQTALALLEWRVEHDPDFAFIVTLDGRQRTYRELAQRISLLGEVLTTAGVRRGDVVGLYMSNDPGWIVALFACWQIGALPACCGALTPVKEAERRF